MNFREFKEKYQKTPVEEYPHKVPESPLVSVCVQTYQHANYIRECLDGILMQKTNFPFEILLGEDCSTDGTREICIEYAEKYPDKIRLFLHHRDNNIAINGTPTGRFNFLYNLFSAKGKYVALCEGDDYWIDPLKLQKQVDFLEENLEYSLTVGGFKINNVNNGVAEDIIKVVRGVKKNENGYIFDLDDMRKGWITKLLTAVFRNNKDVISDFQNYKYGRDINLFYHILKTGKGFYFTKVLGVYNVHDGGIFSTKKKRFQNYLNHYNIYKELYLFNKDAFSKNRYLYSIIALINIYLIQQPKGQSRGVNIFKLFMEGIIYSSNLKDIMSLFFVFVPQKLKNKFNK